MKNIILGILGCMVAVYTIVSCLSIYIQYFHKKK